VLGRRSVMPGWGNDPTESHHGQAEQPDELPREAGHLRIVLAPDPDAAAYPHGRVSTSAYGRLTRQKRRRRGAAPAESNEAVRAAILAATYALDAQQREQEARAAPAAASAHAQAGRAPSAYYDRVRRAVGRGAPTALVGTSTRSLERSLAKLMAVQQGKSTH